MDKEKYIDEIIGDREKARIEKNWALSDEIRNYLDSKNIFIFDTKNGQEIYYPTIKKTRQQIEFEMKEDIRLNKIFDAWLYSILNC